MPTLNMTRTEREEFLSGLHVGVISIADPDPKRAPLAAPIWYDYRPDAGLWVITGPESLKGRALAAAGRFSLVAQTEQAPYCYVSVEGPITSVREADREKDTRPMAHRYLGEEFGNAYIEGQASEGDGSVYTMMPARWLTLDYTKLSG